MNAENPEPEYTFEEALVSLSTYQHADEVPRAFFRRILKIMQACHVPNSEASERMAGVLETSRETIQAKLSACEKSHTPSEHPPRRRDLLSITRL